MSRDFRHLFFSWFEPIWASDSLKYFRIRFRFRRDIRLQSDLCGVQHTAEMISVHTTETIFAVCYTPRRWSPRCATYRGYKLHTAETNSNSYLYIVDFNEIIRRNPFRGEHIYISWKKRFEDKYLDLLRKISAVVSTAEIKKLCDRISRRNQNRIRKYFSLFIRGPYGFESWTKNGCQKSRDTLPLMIFSYFLYRSSSRQ